MSTERIKRHVDRLLDDAEGAVAGSDWELVRANLAHNWSVEQGIEVNRYVGQRDRLNGATRVM